MMSFIANSKYWGVQGGEPQDWEPETAPGWHPMILEALEKIDRIVGGDPNRFRIRQIKEKFGELRFYYSADNDVRAEIAATIEEIEERSRSMCEVCGVGGCKIKSYSGYYKCVCVEHAQELMRGKSDDDDGE
jgi:hypothetical protein